MSRRDHETTPSALVLVRLGALGDVLTLRFALGWIRAHWPTTRILLVSQPGAGGLLRAAGLVDVLIDGQGRDGLWLHGGGDGPPDAIRRARRDGPVWAVVYGGDPTGRQRRALIEAGVAPDAIRLQPLDGIPMHTPSLKPGDGDIGAARRPPPEAPGRNPWTDADPASSPPGAATAVPLVAAPPATGTAPRPHPPAPPRPSPSNMLVSRIGLAPILDLARDRNRAPSMAMDWGQALRVRSGLPVTWDRMRAVRAAYGLPSRYGVLHPGSGSRRKNWPGFRELAARLRRRPALPTWIVTQGEADQGLGEAVAKAGGWAWVDTPPLPDLAAILAGAEVYLGNDSGVTHLAAAVRRGDDSEALAEGSERKADPALAWAKKGAGGVPRGPRVLALFGPSRADYWAPPEATVLQAPGGDLAALSVDVVLSLLSEAGPGMGAGAPPDGAPPEGAPSAGTGRTRPGNSPPGI